MLVYIHGKNVDITDAMHARVDDKLKFMEKYFDLDDSYRANVVVSIYPDGQKVEVTISTKIGLLRAEVKHDDFYAAVDLAVDKLEDQIRRQKTKLSRKNRDSLAQSFLNQIEEENEVLQSDYWEQISKYVELAIENSKTNTKKICHFL